MATERYARPSFRDVYFWAHAQSATRSYMTAPDVDALVTREGPEDDLEAALSALCRSLRSEPRPPRSLLLRDINAWLALRHDAGMPLSSSELNRLVVRIDDLLAAAEVPRPYAVRVGQRLHLSSGMRFH